MKKLIVANWKENKTIPEALAWLKVFARELPTASDLSTIALCASYPLIYPLSKECKHLHLSLKLGAQDVSRYESGAYTGEVSVHQLVDLVDYVLVGHSERQKYFGESLEAVAAKINLCLDYQLIPLVFLRGLDDLQALKKSVPLLVKTVLVYEPPTAISRAGVYRPEEPGAVKKVVSSFKAVSNLPVPVLYGGSVNEKNIEEFLSPSEIGGVVIGQASLDPIIFAQLVKKALRYGAA